MESNYHITEEVRHERRLVQTNYGPNENKKLCVKKGLICRIFNENKQGWRA